MLSAEAVRRRYLVLLGLRWLPVGLLIPVTVLLLTGRGFTLAELGIAWAVQGWLVFVLELPTGGLADAIGRRRVLLGAGVADLVSGVLLVGAMTLPALMVVWALQGVYRALESGPLDAWFIDAALAADPDADVEGAMASGGAVLSACIGVGAVLSSALVAWGPTVRGEALLLPVVVAVALRLVNMGMLLRLMDEVVETRGLTALRASVHGVPVIVREAVTVVRRSPVLLGLIGVELLWGFGMTAFEMLVPPRLAEVTAGPDAAAAVFGPAVSVGWFVSAVAASQVARLSRRWGPPRAAMALHVLQGLSVVGMALAAGPLGVVAFYLVTYATHGAVNPVWKGLLHRQIESSHRTTVASVASMLGMPAGAVSGILLGALADRAGVPVAMIAGAVALSAAAVMYLPALLQWRRATRITAVTPP